MYKGRHLQSDANDRTQDKLSLNSATGLQSRVNYSDIRRKSSPLRSKLARMLVKHSLNTSTLIKQSMYLCLMILNSLICFINAEQPIARH